ncbi:MAG: tetratricopeptide repeat protein [Bacteroidota bacterium]
MKFKHLFITIFFISFVSCNNNKQIEEKNEKILDYQTLKNINNLNIDRLYTEISLKIDDTVKVNNLITIFRLSIKNRPVREDILDEAQNISEKLNYETGLADCLSKKGVNARYNHKYLRSISFHKEAIKHYENSWYIKGKIKNLNSLAVSYRRLNMEEEAIKHYIESIHLSEKNNIPKSTAIALNGIGNSHIALHRYDDAIKYFKRSLSLKKADGSERGMGYDYNNLGEAYMYKKQYDSAFYYHSKSLEIANKLNIKNDKAIIYSSIGFMFQNKGELNKALNYYSKATPTLKENKSKRLLSFTLINTGITYKLLHNYSKAKEYITEGLDLSKEISSKENIVLGHEALSNLSESNGNYKKAIEEYKLMNLYRDSIFNIQSENNMVAMNIKYESEKKDEKINRLKLESKVQNSKIIILILAVAIIIIIAVFSIFYQRISLRNQNLELEEMRNDIKRHVDQIANLKDKEINSDRNIEFVSEKINEFDLTEREKEVLKYISLGLKNKEIANKMFVSLSTVKTHTMNIFNKLDVRNRIEAAKKAQTL